MLSVPTLWIIFVVNFVAIGIVWAYVVRSYPNLDATRFWMAGALVAASEVAAALVALRKRGADSELTDERMARSPRDELRRKLQRLANTIVRDFDAFTAGVVASKVTQTHTGAAWTSGSAIIDNVLARSGLRNTSPSAGV